MAASGKKNMFNEATRVQMPAMVHLTRLGYTYFGKITEDMAGTVYDPDTNILINVFKEQFARLNPTYAGEAEQTLKTIRQELDNDDIGRSFYERLSSVSPVRLVDFENPKNNTYHFTAEFTCKRDQDEFRPDITLFVNGLPLVFVEVKKPNNHGGMVRKHFMKLVRPNDHKFAALHGAVWSGGSFVYVPKGVSVEIPLQSYFRLNAPGAGQFEHTLIIVDEGADLHFIEGCSAPKYNVANLHAGCVELFVGKNAKLRYSTIENWSKNMYNLNTKRAVVEEGGTIEWVSGSFGSHVSYLYPMSILKGKGAKMEFTGITFAGKGQNLDTGAKVVHSAPDTSSYINTRSISKDGGISTFRSSVVVAKEAENSKAAVSCQSLMLDSISRSDTIPAMDIRTRKANVGHEAQIGSISDDAVFYLMSRGMSEEDARACIVSGFADNVSKELPLEYALEMNNLIRLEMKGSIG